MRSTLDVVVGLIVINSILQRLGLGTTLYRQLEIQVIGT